MWANYLNDKVKNGKVKLMPDFGIFHDGEDYLTNKN